MCQRWENSFNNLTDYLYYFTLFNREQLGCCDSTQSSSQSPLKKLFGLRRSRQRKHITPVGFQLRTVTISGRIYHMSLASVSFLVVLLSLIRPTVRSLWRKMSASGWSGTWRRRLGGSQWLIRISGDLLMSWTLRKTTTLNQVVCYKDLLMKLQPMKVSKFSTASQRNGVTIYSHSRRHWNQNSDSFMSE